MLHIRRAQKDAFHDAAVRDFEERMLAHLRDFSPKHFRILDDDEVRAVIRDGMARAEGHGFTWERTIRYYVDMMFMLGSGFDRDPLLPWAAEGLGEGAPADQNTRVDRLYERAWEHVRHVMPDFVSGGSDGGRSRFAAALDRIRHAPDEPLDRDLWPAFVERTSAQAAAMFPSKHAHAGEEAVRRAVARSVERASAHGIATERGALVSATMAFLFGAGFDEDLLLPWAGAILRRDEPAAVRVDLLCKGALGCLKRWWSEP